MSGIGTIGNIAAGVAIGAGIAGAGYGILNMASAASNEKTGNAKGAALGIGGGLALFGTVGAAGWLLLDHGNPVIRSSALMGAIAGGMLLWAHHEDRL